MKKYKILVLSDLNNNTDSILKSTVSLSKIIDADISFFHVKKPTDIVKSESQLSAMRTLNKEQIVTNKKIQDFLDPFSKRYDLDIKFNFNFGNVKQEIKEHIKIINPDIIVLGKRKTKAIKLIGDNITGFVLKTFKGPVMIASNENMIEPKKEFQLGLLNTMEKSFETTTILENLIAKAQTPLRSFNIIESNNDKKKSNVSETQNIVNYDFEKNDNTSKNLSQYLIKNKVNLLCLNRSDSDKKSKVLKSEMKDIIDKVDISLFVH